jgi:hypothetical protein
MAFIIPTTQDNGITNVMYYYQDDFSDKLKDRVSIDDNNIFIQLKDLIL